MADIYKTLWQFDETFVHRKWFLLDETATLSKIMLTASQQRRRINQSKIAIKLELHQLQKLRIAHV